MYVLIENMHNNAYSNNVVSNTTCNIQQNYLMKYHTIGKLYCQDMCEKEKKKNNGCQGQNEQKIILDRRGLYLR